MKSISSQFRDHLAGEVTSIAACWRCQRLDGVTFGFTDHDRELIIDGLAYEASSGYTPTAIRSNAQLSVDNLDAEGMFSSGRITEEDLLAGLWDYAEIRIFEVNWQDLGMGVLRQRRGRLGEVSSGKLSFNAELRGLMQNIQQERGRLYGIACDAKLGDERCKIDLAPLTIASEVEFRNDDRVLFDTTRTEPDGWFNFGLLTWTSGNNDGIGMEVKRYIQSSGLIELVLPMPKTVFIGDTFTMYPGCDKFETTCRTKFNNMINNRSFPHIPGPSRMISGG